MKTKFNKAENQVLTEIYRRLNYFHSGNVNADLLLLALPTTAKILSKYNLIAVSSGREIPKALNWYKLTETGKKFFKPYATTTIYKFSVE